MRYAPERELPPYTYVPGRAPHPVNDPRGHSFGMPGGGILPTPMTRSCPEFLWGSTSSTTRYYWEAHEAWEAVWIAAGRTTPEARFVQASSLASPSEAPREAGRKGETRHTARGS